MLMGAAAAELVSAVAPVPRYRAWAAGAMIALLPDADFAFRIATGSYAPVDRSSTHSLLALGLVAGVAWVLAGRRWSAVTAAAYGSHLVADLLQHQGRTSVAPFWPLQSHGMEPLLPLFPYVWTQRGQGWLEAARGLFRSPSFPALLQETAIAAGIFCAALLLARWLRERRSNLPPLTGTRPAPR
jgi:membrane-bound metal-dependent hydrolase YbcI (DUF457 family)